MNKELDEAWTTIYHYNDEIIHDMGSEYVENPLKEELDIVNNALLELKAIKEAKPDKVLETLKDMLIGNGINDSINDYVDNLILPIKQALLEFRRLDLSLRLPDEQSSSHFTYKNKNLVCMQLAKYSELMNAFLEYEKAQEQEKVLEIIKEKDVDIKLLKKSTSWLDYYTRVKHKTGETTELTEEEFDLLKRWLG